MRDFVRSQEVLNELVEKTEKKSLSSLWGGAIDSFLHRRNRG